MFEDYDFSEYDINKKEYPYFDEKEEELSSFELEEKLLQLEEDEKEYISSLGNLESFDVFKRVITHKRSDSKCTYNKESFKGSTKKMEIVCDIHGVFLQTPIQHIETGCNKCSKERIIKQNAEYFILKSSRVHNNKYTYERVNYTDAHHKVIINCPKHGDFSQLPSAHVRGNGCSICSSSKGELRVLKYLDNKKIENTQQKTFDDCKYKSKLPFDFYLPKYNTCIEYDGEQHYNPIEKWGGVKNLENIKLRDSIKTKYCSDNNITLIRIPYWDFENIETILQTII